MPPTWRCRLPIAVLALVIGLSTAGLADGLEVPVLDPEKVFPGTTLLSVTADFESQRIVEIDMAGKVLWSYPIPESLKRDKGFLLDVNLLDNGHVMFTLHGAGIFEITRQGKVVWSWDGVAAFDHPPFADVDKEGWMHVNSLTRLANSNTLISIRNFNTVVEVDKGGDVFWSVTFRSRGGKGFPATDGPIKGAGNHEPELLENGNLLLALRKPHRYIEVDRESKTIVWKWSHPDGKRAMKTNREANRLPNGNTLVSSRDRLYEVTRDGEIVWQVNAPSGGKNRRKFHKAIRIGPDGTTHGG